MEKSIHSAEHAVFLQELRAVRDGAGVTQDELAEKLGGTQSQISKGERGERRIDVVELRRWVEALGMSLSEFSTRFDSALEQRSGRSGRRKKK